MAKPVSQTNYGTRVWKNLFATLVGIFIALGLLKFGNPVVLSNKIVAPNDFDEFLSQAWPLSWAYFSFVPLIFIGLKIGRWKKPHPILALPLFWLAWQFVSATQTVSPVLTSETLKHFTACIVCLGLGWYALAEVENLTPMWIGIVIGFFLVIREGFHQHFGGLEASRQYFQVYVLPTLAEPPTDLIRKMSSDRIFSTLFYPNTLGGAILLFLPISAAALWEMTARLTKISRIILVGAYSLAGLACLYWSGSKSAWLLMLLVIVLGFLQIPTSKKCKVVFVAAIFAAGMAGFFLKYASFFEKGATSVVARTDYWKAAFHIASENPILGSGPGTFSIPYQKIKSPDAEMARLTHSDYLEQASDSGIPGFLAYCGFIFAVFCLLYRHRRKNSLLLMLLTGLAAAKLQGFSEFNLYVPGLAWPSFLFIGFLLGLMERNQMDNKSSAR